MADIDYDPVTSPEDEEEQRRRLYDSPYPAVSAPSPVSASQPSPAPDPYLENEYAAASPAPAASAGPPPVTGDSYLSDQYSSGGVAPKDTAPKWKDYAPAERSGWGRVVDAISPGRPEREREGRAKLAYDAATKEHAATISEPYRQAQTEEQQAKADKERAEADKARRPIDPKVGLTGEEQTIHDLMTGENGKPRVNPVTKQPYSYLEAFQRVKQAGQDVKPDKPLQTERTVRIIGGVPHEVLINKETGEDIKDLGQTKIPGDTPAEKRSAQEQVQVERESRAAVHKAEQDYNGARSTVAMQRELIKEAKGGNKEAVRMVPLEGALEITTSQGVHRINRTEVEQYGAAGSLFDKIKGAIGSGLSGKNIPDNVLADMDKMTKEMEKNAYGRYKREYDYNKSVVEGYGGKDFDKRVPLVKQEEQQDDGGETKMYQGHEYEKQKDGSYKLKK